MAASFSVIAAVMAASFAFTMVSAASAFMAFTVSSAVASVYILAVKPVFKLFRCGFAYSQYLS